MTKLAIGILGCGFVGSACEYGFSSIRNTKVRVYDKYKPTATLDTVVLKSDILFVCLPTPMRDDGSCDTSIIHSCLHGVNRRAQETSKVIVIKSTVPPGTTDELKAAYPRHKFFFNPEFLTEAKFLDDFLNQRLIVIGETEKADPMEKEMLMTLYRNFVISRNLRDTEIVVTTAKTAEMMKYALNSYLATKVSFCNEIYEICQAAGVNYKSMVQLLHKDTRLGNSHYDVPGPDGQLGFGGKCIPKDLNGLISIAHQLNVDPHLLESVWSKNLVVREDRNWESIPGATTSTRFPTIRPPKEKKKKAKASKVKAAKVSQVS